MRCWLLRDTLQDHRLTHACLRSSLSDQWHVLQGRPDLPDIIESVFEFSGSVGVASCGPRSFIEDVRAAIALEQKDIALGYDVRDVALYTEEFEW